MSVIQTATEDLIHALPCWTGPIAIEPLHGGLSNESHLVTDRNGRFVVRFCRDYPFHHVDRAREMMTAKAAFEAGFAPKVHFVAKGVMVSAFINGKTLNSAELRENAARIAPLIAHFHHSMGTHISGAAYMFWVFHVIRDYARTLSSERGSWSDQLNTYVNWAAAFEAVQVPLPIVFGHNDLLPANFIDDGTKLWLIDFEYAGFSTAMFDIAAIASNADMNQEQSESFLAAYFACQKETFHHHVQIDDAVLRSFLAMQCAATLREAMWAMVSHVHLSTPGVDFSAYAQENLTRFERALENYRKAFP